jgi:hypothetical protein
MKKQKYEMPHGKPLSGMLPSLPLNYVPLLQFGGGSIYNKTSCVSIKKKDPSYICLPGVVEPETCVWEGHD